MQIGGNFLRSTTARVPLKVKGEDGPGRVVPSAILDRKSRRMYVSTSETRATRAAFCELSLSGELSRGLDPLKQVRVKTRSFRRRKRLPSAFVLKNCLVPLDCNASEKSHRIPTDSVRDRERSLARDRFFSRMLPNP